MALTDGDYITLQTRIVDTLRADTGGGGLYEDIGSWPASHGGATRRSVNTIEAEMRGDESQYADTELPAIAVLFDGRDDESIELHAPRNFYKRFRFRAECLVRDFDEEAAGQTAGKIAHRLEELIREQNNAGALFGLATGDIDGMDAGAGGFVDLTGTTFERRDVTGAKTLGRHAAATVAFTVSAPCSFTY